MTKWTNSRKKCHFAIMEALHNMAYSINDGSPVDFEQVFTRVNMLLAKAPTKRGTRKVPTSVKNGFENAASSDYGILDSNQPNHATTHGLVCPDCLVEHCRHCKCEKCSKQGEEECKTCGGVGWIETYLDEQIDCPTCKVSTPQPKKVEEQEDEGLKSAHEWNIKQDSENKRLYEEIVGKKVKEIELPQLPCKLTVREDMGDDGNKYLTATPERFAINQLRDWAEAVTRLLKNK